MSSSPDAPVAPSAPWSDTGGGSSAGRRTLILSRARRDAALLRALAATVRSASTSSMRSTAATAASLCSLRVATSARVAPSVTDATALRRTAGSVALRATRASACASRSRPTASARTSGKRGGQGQVGEMAGLGEGGSRRHRGTGLSGQRQREQRALRLLPDPGILIVGGDAHEHVRRAQAPHRRPPDQRIVVAGRDLDEPVLLLGRDLAHALRADLRIRVFPAWTAAEAVEEGHARGVSKSPILARSSGLRSKGAAERGGGRTRTLQDEPVQGLQELLPVGVGPGR